MRSVGLRVAVAALVWVVVLGAVRFAFALPERCPPVTDASLRTAVADAVDWYRRTQHDDGSILFQYDAASDTDLGGNDPVHHAGTVMALFQATGAGIVAAREPAERALAFAETHLVGLDGWQTFTLGDTYDTGAAALLLIGLADRRAETGDTSKDELMRSLGRFLVVMTAADGSVSDRYFPPTGPDRSSHSPFATGQAFYALAVMHAVFPSESWDEPAQRIGNYLATRRDGVEGDMPDVSDHWAAYGLDVVAHWPGPAGAPHLTDAEVRYAERLAGVVGFQIRWESQRTGSSLNHLVKGHDAIPAGLGTLGEASSALWRAAQVDPRLSGLSAPLRSRAECAAGLTKARQETAAEAGDYPDPSRVAGAWFHDGHMRVDDEQHSISSLLGGLTVLDGAPPTRTGATTDLSGPFAALVLVLAMNPLRAAFGVPLVGRRRRVRLAAGGAGLAALAVVLLAAGATPVLDALDINAPTARIAAGVVVAVTAIVDLFRAPPRPDPALPGPWAALVPVAVPVVFRPALALLAISVAADHGVGPAAVGAVVGAVAVSAAAAVSPDAGTVRRRVLRWGAGVVAVALLAAAIALAVDGIFTV